MTEDAFRKLALSRPEAVESAHMGHPDFRLNGRVFATLGYPKPGWGVVNLTPEAQAGFLAEAPEVFAPAAGAWGRRGSTTVRLDLAKVPVTRRAMKAAWDRAQKGPAKPTG